MGDETVLRASALSGWPACNRMAAARMFRREIEEAGYRLRRLPYGIGAAIGNAVHFGAETVLREKARTGADAPLSLATDAAAQTLGEAIHRGIAYDGPRGVTHDAQTAEAQTLRLVASYHREIVPGVEPILVEERLEAEIMPGIVLSGQPDLVCREPEQVRDLKTTRHAKSGSHAPQAGAYSLLARTVGIAIKRLKIDILQRAALKKPIPPAISRDLDVARAETAAWGIIGHITASLIAFRQGDPLRRTAPGDPWAFTANPDSLLCGERWCPAWGTEFCHEWKTKEDK